MSQLGLEFDEVLEVSAEESGRRSLAQQLGVPSGFADEIENYIVHRVRPTDFTLAVLANDFYEVVTRATSVYRTRLRNIADFVSRTVPDNLKGDYKAIGRYLVVEKIKLDPVLGVPGSGVLVQEKVEAVLPVVVPLSIGKVDLRAETVVSHFELRAPRP